MIYVLNYVLSFDWARQHKSMYYNMPHTLVSKVYLCKYVYSFINPLTTLYSLLIDLMLVTSWKKSRWKAKVSII